MEVGITISTQRGTSIVPITLQLGEKYTYKNSPSTVLVIEHYNAAVPEGNAEIGIVTPVKASAYLEVEDPSYAIKPGECKVFGALPSVSFGSTVEFTASGQDVANSLVKAYALEVRSYG